MSDCSSCSGGSCSTSDDKDRLPPGMLNEYDLNQSTAEGNMVWIETVEENGKIAISDVSLELISKLKQISDSRIFGVIFGNAEVKPLYDIIFSFGVDTLYNIKGNGLDSFHPEAYSAAIADTSKRVNPAVILIGGTPKGREIAPRVAAILQTGLTADCTDMSMNGRDITMTRPAFGGNVIAMIACETYPQMATVRPGVFQMSEPENGRKGTVIYRQACSCDLKEILSSEKKVLEESDIKDAKILISLGKGVERGSIDIAMRIAKKIGASISCSRGLVDIGWMPQNRQVGQSGRNVAPDIYIAFGISGSVQHKAGIGSAKYIIAVNTDRDAPIKDVCDEFIVGDANKILEEIERSLS